MLAPFHLAPTFPVYLHLGAHTIHPHLFFESLAYVIAIIIYLLLRRRFGDPIATPLRWAVVAIAVVGATLGAKLLFWFEDPRLTVENLHNPAYLMGGKTIVGALIGGLIAVEITKRYIGFHTSTGDLYGIPLAVGIAIGRIGCFLTGLSDNTCGTPTTLPWGINFGDGIPRHPTQLYELVFLLALIPFLYRLLQLINQKGPIILSAASAKRSGADPESKDLYHPQYAGSKTAALMPDGRRLTPALLPGDVFKLFMIAYASFRFLADFIKPYPRTLLGIGSIQWACLLVLLYYSEDIRRYRQTPASRIRSG